MATHDSLRAYGADGQERWQSAVAFLLHGGGR
jgi:hypothetical protein